MTNSTITLEATPEQAQELLKAVEISKTVLTQLGGGDMETDWKIANRLSTLSYWQHLIEMKLRQ